MTIAACFLAATFEGLDIQSMGVAAPRLGIELAMDPARLGVAMSASSLGLLIGAAVGGRLSDRHGRRRVLIGALAVLGAFSLATAAARGVDTLVAARLLAGLGLGGVLPMLIAMTAEAAPPTRRATALALVYCGLPVGGMAAGAIAALSPAWRTVFLVGGAGPLLLALLLPSILSGPADAGPPSAAAPSSTEPASLARLTLALWLAYFLTLLVVYALLNWLPSLLAGRGIARAQAAAFSIVLNGGAVLGSLFLGAATDRLPRSHVLTLTYGGMAAALVALAFARAGGVAPAVFAAGFAVIGGQLVLYALAPALYPAAKRGAGVGAAVAAGRLGSIVGPAMVGFTLAGGTSPAAIPLAALPLLAIAAVAALVAAAACPD